MGLIPPTTNPSGDPGWVDLVFQNIQYEEGFPEYCTTPPPGDISTMPCIGILAEFGLQNSTLENATVWQKETALYRVSYGTTGTANGSGFKTTVLVEALDESAVWQASHADQFAESGFTLTLSDVPVDGLMEGGCWGMGTVEASFSGLSLPYPDADVMFYLANEYNILAIPGTKCETYIIDDDFGHCLLARRLHGSSIQIKYNRTEFPQPAEE